jgi:endoribonuclease Dicer
MHVARQKIISNRALLQNAREADVPQYIQSKPFTPKAWVPYNFKVARFVPPAKSAEPDNDAVTIPQDAMEIDEQEPATISSTDPAVAATPPRQASAPALEEGEMEDPPPEEQAQPSSIDTLPIVGDAPPKESDSAAQNKQVRKRWEDVRVQWLGDKVMI